MVHLRMCIACRTRKPQNQLIRICKTKQGEFTVDGKNFQDCKDKDKNSKNSKDLKKSKRGQGRGAYICSKQCLEKCKKGRLLNRAFKCEIQDSLLHSLEEEF